MHARQPTGDRILVTSVTSGGKDLYVCPEGAVHAKLWLDAKVDLKGRIGATEN
ncbi:hypothetical protein AB0O76_11710 [Streptomyces sp. NPDC086554]|uniref:hypothetical protein n=1 Tax=Streptomyces sp. NPDC086554 TaxID=3154864 RepID=UPI003439360E